MDGASRLRGRAIYFWLLLLTITGLAGCTVPGHYLDKSWMTVERSESDEGRQSKIKVLLVTPALIEEMRNSRKKIKPRENTQLEKQKKAFEYRVGPQDVLSVTVWGHPELTIPAGEFRSADIAGHLVNASGKIFFPYAGETKVSGLTVAQIRDLITKKIKKYIVKPQLDVRVAAYRSQKVHVVGEVKKSGVIPITDVPLTLLDAIDQAGGYGKEADLESVTVTRNASLQKFNMLALYDGGDVSQNMLLRNGDIVHIPDRSQKKIFVLGEVKKPTAYLMHKGRMSLAEAIGFAEGFETSVADTGKIYILRGAPEGVKVYWLDARSPDTLLLSTQFALAPQDVVYVSTAGVARWNRLISQILPSVQLLWQTKTLLQ